MVVKKFQSLMLKDFGYVTVIMSSEIVRSLAKVVIIETCRGLRDGMLFLQKGLL